ncbi:DNA primase [Tissierella sp. Yu-01]|uniref:DNA primase n=1 Tax=Tissierella sp. Yu-01 TaxID=3035694 RepID=UPI00240DDB53|nr:DNA primase [Tissierella sp. Yu-01]WFA09562.1 DNA primase [Tissierella sp. Yu-01]
MTYINDEIIEKVKDNSDIVNIISDYVNLKKSGTNYIGLCPFHNEKTPSFTVSETKQIFHCFGCGEGGDAVTFIMKRENLDFPEAVKLLADRLGIEIDVSNNKNSIYKDEKSKTYEINKEAARFFYNNLIKSNIALEYLKNRGISSKVIRQFGLGYSLDSWQSLYNYLRSKDYEDEEIEKTGLIGKKSGNNGYYDKFRNRIIFPIIDTKSRVIGFGGRVMDKSMPKYLNSPDTVVFNKGNHLYGLNLVNKFSNRSRILLVEGYMDVISLFNRGIHYSVASLGTALTERQSKIIKRYGDEVFICYDSDQAGIKATIRAIDIMLKLDINPKVLDLPQGMDPDDFIKNKGPLEFEKLFMNAYNHIDFKVRILKNKYNIDNLEEKIKFTTEVSNIIKNLKNPIEQDGYIDKISRETGITRDAIERQIKGNNTYDKKKKPFNNETINKENIKPVKAILPSAHLKAEIELVKLMIKEKDFYEYISQKLTVEDFSSFECKTVYGHLNILYKDFEIFDEKVLFDKILEIPNLDKNTVNLMFNNDIKYKATDITKIIDDLIKTVKLNNLLNKRKEMLKKIEELEKKTRSVIEEDTLKKLCLDLIALNNEINLNN